MAPRIFAASLTSVLALAALAGALVGSSCARTEHGRREVMQGDCVVCHQPEYDATLEPPHAGLFDTTCADCHVVEAWVPAQAVQHDWFVLRNRHAEQRCSACHTVGYAPGDTPSTCEGCHRDDYDAATMPPHAGYPLACADCHTDAGWRPSTFAHPWTLDGAHARTPCASCHLGDPPTYRGTPTECVGCHREDYDSSPYPGHTTFPTTCATCHTTTAWRPALEGGHPEASFPIAGGPHDPFECLDCHDPARGSSLDGMNTDCIGCHTGEHSRASVDADHREVSGYPLGTSSVNYCLDCHPNGRN